MAVVALTAPALLLAACGSGGGGAASSSAAAPSESSAAPSESTSASASPSTASSCAAAGPVTLKVQSGNGGSDALLKGYEELNTAFEAANPGVTVDFTVKNFTDLVNTLKLQLSGTDVPDVTQVNQGYGSLGQLVGAQLVDPLDQYAEGWKSRQTKALLDLNGAFSPDGATMGSGQLYAIAATGAWVGLFMNVDNAKKAGITAPPTTVVELEEQMAKAKAAGITPMMYGTKDGAEPIWLWASLVMASSSPQVLTDMVNGTNKDLPPASLAAAEVMKKWTDAGYFTDGFAAFESNDVMQKFGKGDGLFVLNGSWNVFASDTPENYKLVAFPLGDANKLAAIATGDLPWSIPTKAKNKECAAAYLDFITNPANNPTWIKAGQVPASVDGNESAEVEKNGITGVSADAILRWVELQQKGQNEPFPDWATPTWYDTISKNAVAMQSGEISPQEFVQAVQDDYSAFLDSKDD